MDEDIQFFTEHRDRYARIREPKMVLAKSPQRAVYYRPESEGEFWSLGEHNKDRRRILVWRVPESHPDYDPKSVKILKIPFLLFADETVEDNDATLLPIIHQIISEKAKQLGMKL
ncbi:MAG: hypothetical protein WA192_06285 [Candidatus Acidiferrales bacterium]